MAETDQLAQLPTQLSPQALATLFPGGQSATLGVPTTAAPTAAPTTGVGPLDDPNLRAIIQQQSQAGMGAFGERERAAMDINRQLAGPSGLIQQQEEASKHLAWHPNMVPLRTHTDPATGQVIPGHGVGGFLHNLGQALLAVGAATTPGQAIEGIFYQQPRQEYAGRAERIKSLQEEQKALSEGMAPAAQLAYKPFQAEAAERKASAAEVTAQARMNDVISRHQDAIARIAATKDIAAKRNATLVEVTKMRDEMLHEITSMKDVTQEDVARIMASSAQTLLNTKIGEDPSLWGDVKRAWLGIGGMQAPGGEQPITGVTPPPARTPKKPAAAPPARPKGVPSDAKWDAKTHTWYK